MGEKIILIVMILLFLVWMNYKSEPCAPLPGYPSGIVHTTFPMSPERLSDMRGLAKRLDRNGYSDAADALDQTLMTMYVDEELHAESNRILREQLEAIPIEEWDYINGPGEDITTSYDDN